MNFKIISDTGINKLFKLLLDIPYAKLTLAQKKQKAYSAANEHSQWLMVKFDKYKSIILNEDLASLKKLKYPVIQTIRKLELAIVNPSKNNLDFLKINIKRNESYKNIRRQNLAYHIKNLHIFVFALHIIEFPELLDDSTILLHLKIISQEAAKHPNNHCFKLATNGVIDRLLAISPKLIDTL